MKKYIVFSLLFIQYMVGQELPKVVPLSPEASSLFKFMDVPVSLYAGTQNTSIPLLEIKTGGLSIPISLSYSSRGVLVSELASRVGNGWSLNYGGMISRQIRGSADEKPFGYNSNPVSLPAFYSDAMVRQNYIEDEAIYQSQNDLFAQTDYYPDKFMLNSNFYSGEFFFDKKVNKFLVQKYSDIKIHSTGASEFGYTTFSATDNMGNRYVFGGLDVNSNYANEYDFIENSFNVPFGGSASFSANPNSNISFNTFNLKEITTPSNEKVEYSYEDETVKMTTRTGDIQNQYSVNYNVGDPLYTCTFNVSYSHQKVLKEIKCKDGIVKFIKSSAEREDLTFGHALDRIEQYNVKGELIKLIKFNYVYNVGFEDPSNINYYLLMTDSTATKRLFLESIVFTDAVTNKEEKYLFEYDDQELPSRHSNSIDSWGYYNGKKRGNYLIFDDVAGKTGVDPVKMQAGILKKVTYPTGGFTVFEYEPNILNNELPNDIYIQNPNKVFSNVVMLSNIEPDTYHGNGLGQYEKQFSVVNPIGHKAIINAQLPDMGITFAFKLINISTGSTTFLAQGENYEVAISDGTYKLVVDPDYANWNPYPIANPTTDRDYEHNLLLMNNSFVVSLTYNYSEYDYNSIIYGPGNRIKKITNFSANDKEEFARVYEYKNDLNSLSGYLLSVSNFKVHRNPDDNNPLANALYWHTPNLPGGKFSSYMKDNFGYTQVNEYLSDKLLNTNEKTSHYYSLVPDIGRYYRFPLHPVADNEWLRGKELLTKLYKKENNSFRLIKEIENEFLLYGTTTILYPSYPLMHPTEYYIPAGFVDQENLLNTNTNPYPHVNDKRKFCYPNSTGCPYYLYGNPVSVLGYRTSFFTGGTFDLHTTKTTEYFDNDTKIENLTTYEYDYDHHYNVAKILTKNSIDDIKETRYYYASSPEMETEPNVQGLIDNNIVGIPLDTQTYKINDKLSEQKTIYKSVYNILLPDYVQTSKGNADLETRIHYTKYDELGNPIEVQTENGMKICYIWGYNKTQPLAKIENIAYVEIPENLITDLQHATTITETNSGSPEDVVIGYQTALRNSPALANAMVTTYTYKLLVGVTTITDPRGYLTRYEYDPFGRLESVYDAAGNRLSNNQYHYRTQD